MWQDLTEIEITICIDWSIVDIHKKRKKYSKRILIEPHHLIRWTPRAKLLNVLFSPESKINFS